MTARRLTHLTARLLLTLPLAACAAQPGPGQATGRPDAPASDARSAAAAPSTAPAPAAAPAAPVAQATQAGTDARQAGGSSGNSAAAPRHTAAGHADRASGNATTTAGAGARAGAPSAAAAGTSATGTSATGTSATGTSANNTSAAGTAATDAPAAATSTTGAATGPAPAAATAPDVVAPRPATAGTPTPGALTPGATVPPVTMPAGSPTGGLLQTLFALILVLAVLGALAWFLKRYGPRAGGGNANLRVVGSLNLGGRERIMVVEVGNQWIVVGASPGRINALATLPRQDGQNGDTDASDAVNAALARQGNAAPGAHSFADWLKQTIDKRK